MSDSSDLNKYKLYEPIVVPSWLYGMPEKWHESYFDLSATCAISMYWGEA